MKDNTQIKSNAQSYLHEPRRSSDNPDEFRLEDFLPYRLVTLASEISHCVGRSYRDEFGLSVQEWRVLANLGNSQKASAQVWANEVAAHTGLDKVQVSRTISRMMENGLVSRKPDSEDRRRSVLTLTDKGKELYNQIVPAAVTYERQLLEGMSDHELACIDNIINKLRERATILENKAATLKRGLGNKKRPCR